MSRETVPDEVVTVLTRDVRIHRVELIGSRARGTVTAVSDWDFTVTTAAFEAVRDALPTLTTAASGKMRRRMAAEELADIDRIDARLKAMKAELKATVLATGSTLMDIHGIGPAGAARILADVGDIARFPDRGHFASWTGTAPIDASSGAHIRHRLSRAGNRRLNHVLHMAGIVQLRNDTQGRRYYRRRLADGKTPMEAMRCLRRRLSDVVYRQLVNDAIRKAGPGGHSGASLSSSAADLTPVIGSSDQPLPGPAQPTLLPPAAATKPAGPGTGATTRQRARGVNVQRPTGRTTLTPTSAAAPLHASRTTS